MSGSNEVSREDARNAIAFVTPPGLLLALCAPKLGAGVSLTLFLGLLGGLAMYGGQLKSARTGYNNAFFHPQVNETLGKAIAGGNAAFCMTFPESPPKSSWR